MHATAPIAFHRRRSPRRDPRPLAALLLALGLTVATRAAEIVIRGSPELPAPNLVVNPGADQGSNRQPLGWRFTTARPDNFETGWIDGGRAGRCLWAKARTGVMSGYWGQSVAVKPGESYLFKGFYRLASGKMLVYAHGRAARQDGTSVAIDERFYRGTARGHWLVPVFLPPQALGGPDPNEWLPFRIRIEIPEQMRAIALSLGLFFQPGEAWFDDLSLAIAETDLSVSVKAAEDETIWRVTVTRADAQRPIFVSPTLASGTRTFATLLEHQPADTIYTVTVSLGDGTLARCSYPATEPR